MTIHTSKTKAASPAFPIPMFRLAFRPFFWFSALFGVISIALWALSFTGDIHFAPYGGSYFWHIHEMLFGFTSAVVVGFLLTAVQNWTGVSSIKGTSLLLLFLLWFSARVLLILPGALNVWLISTIDLLFLPVSALAMAKPIVKVRQWRNLFFVPILLVMTLLNSLMHLALAGYLAISFPALSYPMVLLISLVMSIMAGRVFPMFTANGTRTERVASIPIIEKLAIGSILMSVIVTIEWLNAPAIFVGVIYLFTGMVNFVRALRWRIWVTFSTPLVWSLHLSYWMLCLGYVLLGLSEFQIIGNASTALHALTVGGIGFMVLSMISRVSLGHTGRPIMVGKTMTIALVMIGISALCRVLLPYLLGHYSLAIQISAAFWVVAYGIFVVRYAPVLFRSRADGRDG